MSHIGFLGEELKSAVERFKHPIRDTEPEALRGVIPDFFRISFGERSKNVASIHSLACRFFAAARRPIFRRRTFERP